ncbi:hypothetical protein [Paenibacillus sp. GCM10028914]|uniref:hypothetical protein n=1 Tax=Paenibacillus sp. GCM10028914 TaxID=3273416 RepID=UPI003613EDCF
MKKQPPSSPAESKEPSQQPKITFIPPVEKKHSGLGITSFILSVISLIGYIIMASLGSVMLQAYVTPEGVHQPTQEAIEAMTSLAAVFFIIAGINLIGFILGMVGAFSKKQKKSYSIIGAIINGVVLITILIIFLVVLNG